MISELFAKYQFGAIHRYAGRYGKVMNRALCSAESEMFRRIRDIPPFIPARNSACQCQTKCD